MNCIATLSPRQLDYSGEKCGTSQNDPNVWFLVQISEGEVVSHCTVPSDKAIFFPVLTGECDFLSTPEVKTELELAECAVSGIEGAIVSAEVDGIELNNLQRLRAPLFNLTLIPDNIFSSATPLTGPTQGIAEGYYVFLEPFLQEHTK